jgi:hypothetical protein
MQERLLDSFFYSFNYKHLTKATSVFFSTVVTNLLFRNISFFAQAETQQSSSIINFVERGRLPIVGTPTDIAVQGNYAFISTLDAGLQIIDISDSSFPFIASNYTINDTVTPFHEIAINKKFLYLAANINGLYILNITAPLTPTLEATYNTGWSIIQLETVDNMAFLAGNRNTSNKYFQTELAIIDMNTPSQPIDIIGLNYHPGSVITDMLSQPKGILMSYTTLGLAWLEAATNKPGSIVLPSKPNGLAVKNGIAYVADNMTGLIIINISNPTSPKLLANYTLPVAGLDVSISNNIAFVANGIEGLQIINVSNPENPFLLTNYTLPFAVTTVQVSGNLVFILYGSKYAQSLAVIDVSEPTNPKWLSSYTQNLFWGSICVKNNILYLVESIGNLNIIDLNNPSNPQFLTSYTIFDTGLYNVNVDNNYLYVTADRQLQILDVTNPAKPLFLGNFYENDYHVSFYEVVGRNNMAYVIYTSGNGTYSLEIIDVSNPLRIQLLGGYDLRGTHGLQSYPHSISADDGIIVIIDNFSLYSLIKAPLFDSRFSMQTFPRKIAASNNYSYVVDQAATLHVISIQNKLNFTEVSANYWLKGSAQSMKAVGDFLYSAELSAGVEIVDVYNPLAPQFVTQLMAGITNAKLVALSGKQLFVVDASQGLIIYDIQGQPLLVNHQFSVIPGIEFTVTTTQLSARDTNVDANSSQLTFMISNIQNGQFELTSQPGASITSFKQQDILAGNVIFVPTNLEALPSFQVSVSNSLQTTSAQNMSVVYGIDAPRIVNNSLSINEGETKTLTVNDLSAIVTIPGKQLTFTTNRIKNGRFQSVTAPNIFVTTFSPNDIKQKRIQFVATGGESDIPGYEVVCSDGQLSSLPSIAAIDYNAAPRIITNQLAIIKGTTLTLSKDNLEARDVDSDNAKLVFTMSGVQHGSFNQLNFTQQALYDGSVQFTHDGSDQTPIYYINVSDGRIQVGPEKAVTTLSNNLIPIIAGSTAGGVALLSTAVGIGFWYRKRVQDANTRKQYQFADYIREELKLKGIDNFKNEKGQRYVGVIQKLMTEFSHQGEDLNQRSDSELKAIAKDVAKASKNKITYSTTCLGYSEITIEDIDYKIPAIVQDVLRIRAGFDDTNIPMSSL